MRIWRIVLLLLLVCGGALAGKAASARTYVRWAYYGPSDPRSYQSLAAHHRYLDIISPDAWVLWPDGSVTSRMPPKVVAQMRRWGLKVVPMIAKYNWDDTMPSFFASPAARQRAAREMTALVLAGDYDGINIDIENVRGSDGPAFESLVADVSARMRANGRLMTMTLPARTAGRNPYPAFNFARLGAMNDYLVVMAYDYSYAAGPPGPVAPMPWVRDVAAYSVSQIPRSKVLLGVSWYGYSWNTTAGRLGRYVGHNEVSDINGEYWFDTRVEAPGVQYSLNGQRHVSWFENARSVAPKFKTVVDYDLGGWAAWRLGYDDPAIWRLINPRR